MPYTVKTAREYFDAHPHEAKDDGDLTYLIYKLALAEWKKEPRYKTWAGLKKGQRDVRYLPHAIKELMMGLDKNGVAAVSYLTAYDCALEELRDRFIVEYEKTKRDENGDIE